MKTATQGELSAEIPTFLLYGERALAEVAAEPGFVHVETITARAGLHDWAIRAHRHRDLVQLMLVVAGGGELMLDGERHDLTAPSILAIPSTLVHAFAFQPDTRGYVLTASESFLQQILNEGAEPMKPPGGLVISAVESSVDAALLRGVFEALYEEFQWARPGRTRAICAYLNLALVILSRVAAERPARAPSSAAILVARLRPLIHAHAADWWALEDYAKALNVAPDRLTRACRQATGRSLIRQVHDRLLLEAKRNLLYTCMSVQEIGAALGFSDPAYFSRFFSQREGVSPLRFRRQAEGGA